MEAMTDGRREVHNSADPVDSLLETGFKEQPRRSREDHAMSMDESPILSITVDTSNHDLVLAVDGEMDAATADALRNALEAVEPTDSTQVVVDLEHVSFIDSKGLLALLEGRDRLAQR